MTRDNETKVVIPRIRARAFQDGSGWKNEVIVSIGETVITEMVFHTTFISRDAALKELNQIVPEMLKTVCEGLGCPIPEEYINLKTGTTEKFKETPCHKA